MLKYANYIRKKITAWYESKELYETYLKRKFDGYKYICIFGLGNIGIPTLKLFQDRGLNVDFLSDNDVLKWGREFYGITCISPAELVEYKDDTLVIICGRAFNEILLQLKEMKFPHIERIDGNKFYIFEYLLHHDIKDILEKLERVIDICSDDESKRVYTKLIDEWTTKEYREGFLDEIYSEHQYFPKDIIKLQPDEVFVDAGAYNGDTLSSFLEISNYNLKKYYCYELSKKNTEKLNHFISNLEKKVSDKIVIINKGVSDKQESIFYSDNDEGSKIDNEGNTEGYITTIDESIDDEITFIKMDIEGSELAALRGAQRTIKEYKPKLAICLYHNPWDIWEIPLYIKENFPQYKIYIRHHTNLLNETVCYACCK